MGPRSAEETAAFELITRSVMSTVRESFCPRATFFPKENNNEIENVPLTVEKRKAIPRTIITRSSGSRQAPFQEQGGPVL